MTRLRSGVLFAAALFPDSTPLAKRLEQLEKHFEPKPGSMSLIDPVTIRDRLVIAKNVGKFGGAIKIKPPKGLCFSITTSPDRADIRVCKERFVYWSLADLNLENGSIQWTVKTGDGDFGTPITWKTPYTVAKVLPPEAEFFKANSTPIYFKTCVATSGDNKLVPRKVTLTKFDNTKWVIRLPEKDERITSLNISRPGEVWGENEKIKKPLDEKAPAVSATPNEHAEPAGEAKPSTAAGHGEGHGDTPPLPPEAPKEDLEPWTIDSGRAFQMPVENFISDVSMPPGRKGYCRYVFDHVPGHLERGRIECHDTGQYRYVYAFLPCMGTLAPPDLHGETKPPTP